MTTNRLSILFICHGPFNCNSGGHIAGFANSLSKRGHAVGVLAAGDPSTASDFGPPLFQCFSFDNIDAEADRLSAFLKAPNRLLHAWTPREKLRRFTEKLGSDTRTPIFVHLEDNEDYLVQSFTGLQFPELSTKTSEELDALVPEVLSHPLRYKEYLRRTIGVTVIIESLGRFVPEGVPTLVLHPGLDEKLIEDLPKKERSNYRSELGFNETTTVILYHGNMHAANRRELFSLYVAILILRRRGHDVHLLRCGDDWCDDYDISQKYVEDRYSTELGRVDRVRLVCLLKLADLFIQPGSIDEFNKFRFPSKIPEFLARGRPVVLPRTNIGLKLKDDVEAMLMDIGDGTDIANKVERLLLDPQAADLMGRAGRAFAMRQLSWDTSAAALEQFYRSALDGHLTQT